MPSDVTRLLEQLDKKELYGLANQRQINVPKNWPKSLVIELLAQNVSLRDLQTFKAQPLKARTQASRAAIG